jgi:hypothetical protein
MLLKLWYDIILQHLKVISDVTLPSKKNGSTTPFDHIPPQTMTCGTWSFLFDKLFVEMKFLRQEIHVEKLHLLFVVLFLISTIV